MRGRRFPLFALLLALWMLTAARPALALWEAALSGEMAAAGSEETGDGDVGETGDISIEDGVDAWLGELDLSQWQAFLATLPENIRALWADADLETLIVSWAAAGPEAGIDPLLDALGALLLDEARASAC